MRMPPRPKPIISIGEEVETLERSMPKSACTAGSATLMTNIPVAPMVMSASVTDSLSQA